MKDLFFNDFDFFNEPMNEFFGRLKPYNTNTDFKDKGDCYEKRIWMPKKTVENAEINVSVEDARVCVSWETKNTKAAIVFFLPDDADESSLEATLKDDGIYLVAKKKPKKVVPKERPIKINYINKDSR